MSQRTLCRLCISTCSEFKCLYDDNGKQNRVYYIAVKFFDPLILNPICGESIGVICIKCWQLISEFYSFQQSVVQNQAQLKSKKIIVRVEKLTNQMIETLNATIKKELTDDANENPISVFDIVKIPDVATTRIVNEAENDYEMMIQDTSHAGRRSSNIPTPKEPAVCGGRKEKKSEMDHIIDKWFTELKCFICKETFPEYNLLLEHFLAKHPSKYVNELIKKKQKLSHNQEMEDIVTDSCVEISDNEDDNGAIEQMENDGCVEISDEDRDERIIEIDDDDENSNDFVLSHRSLLHSNQTSNNDASSSNSKYFGAQQQKYDKFIAKHKPQLECPLCKNVFDNYNDLLLHFKSKHPSEKCHVFCCNRRFFYRYALVEHILKHTNPNAYKCHICGKNLSLKASLKRHILVTHKEQLVNEEPGLFNVINGKSREKILKQSDLDQTNVAQSSLEIYHETRQLPDASPFVCNYCNRSFNKKAALSRHQNNCLKKTNQIMASDNPMPTYIMASNSTAEQFSEETHQSYPSEIDCGFTINEISDVNTQDQFAESSSEMFNETTPQLTAASEFTCIECNRSFTSKAGLTRHQKNCLNKKNQITSKTDYQHNQMTATYIVPTNTIGEQSYDDQMQNDLSQQNCSLTSADMFPFVCNLCDRSYTCRSSLTRHQISCPNKTNPIVFNNDNNNQGTTYIVPPNVNAEQIFGESHQSYPVEINSGINNNSSSLDDQSNIIATYLIQSVDETENIASATALPKAEPIEEYVIDDKIVISHDTTAAVSAPALEIVDVKEVTLLNSNNEFNSSSNLIANELPPLVRDQSVLEEVPMDIDDSLPATSSPQELCESGSKTPDNDLLQEMTFINAPKSPENSRSSSAHELRTKTPELRTITPDNNLPSSSASTSQTTITADWKKLLVCRICNITYKDYSTLRDHFQANHPNEKLEVLANDVLAHLKRHAFKCDICECPFASKMGLSRHKRSNMCKAPQRS